MIKNKIMKTKVIEIQEVNVDELADLISEKLLLKLEAFKKELDKKEEVLLRREEVQKILKVSLVTIWHWTKLDILKSYRLGNRIYYKKQEVLDSLQKANCFDD